MSALLRRWAWLAAAIAAGLVLAACGNSSGGRWHAKDVAGLLPDLRFGMTDDHDRAVGAGDFRGDVVLLYFGYTHCADVCPATIARLSRVVRDLGTGGRAMRILFVTVDPQRDTTAHMAQYAHAFGPAVVGLRGTARQTEALVKRYRVSYSHGKPDARGDYEVMHSSAVFVFDRQGHARLLFLSGDSVAAMRADLDRLARESAGLQPPRPP